MDLPSVLGMFDGVMMPLCEKFSLLFFVLAVDRCFRWEKVYSTDVWLPLFVQDGFVEDDTPVSFTNELNDAELGYSSDDMVKWDLDSKGALQSYYEPATFELSMITYVIFLEKGSLTSSFGGHRPL